MVHQSLEKDSMKTEIYEFLIFPIRVFLMGLVTVIIIPVGLLAILYFIAKVCFNDVDRIYKDMVDKDKKHHDD